MQNPFFAAHVKHDSVMALHTFPNREEAINFAKKFIKRYAVNKPHDSVVEHGLMVDGEYTEYDVIPNWTMVVGEVEKDNS